MSEPLSPVNQVIASRYRVVRELGRGGMGVVYVVEHVRTGDRLALKLLHGQAARDPLAIERFKREAQAAARIRSEHIVKVVDADVAPELEGAPFLVMELLDGLDLEKLLAERGRLSGDEALGYLGQAARALDRSHAMGIIHRDLKPENLFLHRREDGTSILKILDFGISKLVGAEGGGDLAGAGMTSTGAVMGTPLYMAPEQARGLVSQISAATDVWAIGLIAIRLLTGEIYWQATTVAALMVQICADPLYAPTQRWPWLPAAIDPWFARSCARDPSQRFRGVGEQVDALAEALGLRGAGSASVLADPGASQSGASSPQPVTTAAAVPGAATTTRALALGGTSPPAAPRSRPPLVGAVAAGLAAVALLGLAGGAWVARSGFEPRQPRSPSASTQPPPSPSAPLRAVTTPSVVPSATGPAITDGGAATAADAATSSDPSSRPSAVDSGPPGHAPTQVRAPRPGPAYTPTSP